MCSLKVDFVTGKADFRRKHPSKELLTKACGLKKGNRPTIIDATAGLGRDAFVLASQGCQVTMLERSPELAALLKEALKQLHTSDPSIQLDLVHCEAKDYLAKLPEEQHPDVIYLDPMHPTRKKSALVKKEMRELRELVGEDQDAAELFEIALKTAKKRVVVKRPRTANPLSTKEPNLTLTGKSTRFDVYFTVPRASASGSQALDV